MRTQDNYYSIQDLYRQLYGKMVASLASYFGMVNLSLAEDLVQETFITALERWEVAGMPQDPAAWLFKVCKHKTINALSKRQAVLLGTNTRHDEARIDYQLEHLFLDHEIKDNQLRLLFACCHPRLSPKAQIILILKNLCGLRTNEIGRALTMTEEAVVKTLTRSRHILVEENVSLQVPFLLRSHQRLSIVHMAIYLLFNEGYTATDGDWLIRRDLCLEAMRLMKSIIDIPVICTVDTYALMALMCFHTARFESRMGATGEFIALELQDRQCWDKDMITLGTQYLKKTKGAKTPTRFIIEAAIVSAHCMTPSFKATPWIVIKGLYDQLQKLYPSPFTDLNRAVAVFYTEGPDSAIKCLAGSDHLRYLQNHYLYYALLGKIYHAQLQNTQAIEQYKKALSLTKLRAEQDFLQDKIEMLMC